MFFSSWPILSIIVWLPIVAGIFVMSFGAGRASVARWFALAISVLVFGLSVALLPGFDTHTYAMQFVERVPWIPQFGINYHLGVDGISLPLLILTTFTTVLVIVAAWDVIKEKAHQYLAAFLIMEGMMNGTFAALDAIVFYFFFEAMLIPMFIVIGIWGGPKRVFATIKFFLYTFLGSVFMLIALIYMYFKGGSFSILAMQQLPLSMNEQILIFLALFIAFAVKIPMWPVHTWLPDAHVEAPTGGSVILAAIMLKIGGYGFLRFSLPITPDASALLDGMMIAFSLIAIVYIGFVALAQSDMKKLVAYSSISHMGFVTLGIFVIFMIYDNAINGGSGIHMALEGAMVQMISHGLISAAMFLSIGVLYDRLHSREISAYGGVVNTMPWFAAMMMVFAMANVGLPGTSGFVGEFMVILAAFKANFWIALLAALTLIIGASYTLWMVKRVFFGEIQNQGVAELNDVNPREAWMLGSLVFLIILLGVWPNPLLDLMHATIEHLAQQALTSKL
ncbi:MAG: NADH-quinone oxidoreductase subunit M [Halothiobacillus sp. 24-54-40]|nr:MAG: NADH-quinone oxidoreductase subunit M [Halothiobacillus sp. 35-54-62]OYZ88448.1 MAG: NADH-quinone oxidoreductase subunit M [Halothiobacillus sp. 24-54-40]OZA81757.1 MAG: NADH-quinone oxidoreductase subunit M [Halothiobacillus sp. 39-53-45]HQS01775.1 NADH-quinone oxidoreductase subunit M [Halothiobacillus sp.]HQS28351.1 NADH-quinone oxidoreductase subunit M [Halothiobacillus sp.]